MSRSVRVLVLAVATVAVAAVATGLRHPAHRGQPVPEPSLYAGAQLFSQRCGGCHTLSYAATHGSAPNIRTAQANSGPNFNIRCERPITRVLYAIENGGFSGAYMPQNVVVGQDAIDVAKFVATYAGRQEPLEPGTVPCQTKPIGTLPAGSGTVNGVSSSGSSGSSDGDHGGVGGCQHERLEVQGQVARRRPRRRPAILDIRLIRRDPDAVRAALSRRGPDAAAAVDRVLELDERWRALTTELEQLRAEQNQASRALKGAPSEEQREQLAALAARGRGLSDEETALRSQRDAALASLPNLPADDAPAQDTVLREVGEAGQTGRDHLELAGEMIDMERAAQLSGFPLRLPARPARAARAGPRPLRDGDG